MTTAEAGSSVAARVCVGVVFVRIPLKLLPAIGLVCASCAGDLGLTSGTGDEEGIVYHLPRTILEITVREYRHVADDRVWYSLGGPKSSDNPGNIADTNSSAADVPTINRIRSETVPDLHHRYVIKYHPSHMSDDRLCISRKPNGLLQDVQFAADDRTPQIVFNIAQFVGGLGGSKVYFNQNPADTNAVTMRSFTAKVDPFDPEEKDVNAFNNSLKRIFKVNLKLNFKKLVEEVRSVANLPPGCSQANGCPTASWGVPCDHDHICYRTKLKLPVGLDLDNKPIDAKYAEVINPWDIGSISVTRAFLVKKVTKLRFEEGALLAAIIRKPSEVEEASLMPLNVMNAILTVPSGLWQSAFSDPKTMNAAINSLEEQNSAVANYAKIKHESLLLEGTKATAVENYDLNCSVAGTKGKPLNWLQAGNEQAQ